jgi:hypothetical protein
MYKLSVPVNTEMMNGENKNIYLQLIKNAGAERVLLISNEIFGSRERQNSEFKHIREMGEFFNENGIETSIWVGCTIGHGAPLGTELDNSGVKFQRLVELNGEAIPETRCPFDEDFCEYVGDFIKRLQQNTGIKLIFLDDDYRLSQHGTDFCCACELHMKRICEILNEDISREELKKRAFFEKANKYRLAWLQAQRESLERLATTIRRHVDTVDENACVALCAAHSIWGVDGSSAISIAKILAGKNKPVARLHPAPYWAIHSGMPLQVVFELARMFAEFSKNSGAEIIAEGDSYPRPRYSTPASVVELFDAFVRADGRYDGDLKYMLDYCSPVNYEMGYIRHHERNLPFMKEITEIFEGKGEVGVYVPTDKDVMEYADFSLSNAYYNNYPFPSAATLFARLGIPTAHSDNGICTALFGENARRFPLEKIKNGAVIDAVSAKILLERGVDTGLTGEQSFFNGEAISLIKGNEKYLVCINHREARFMETGINESATVTLSVNVGDRVIPIIYNYVNDQGQKFTVLLADAMSLKNDSALFTGYAVQALMIDAVEWISGKRLPVKCVNNPDIYLLTKKSENKQAVLFINASADSVLEPVFTLDEEYKQVRGINCGARINKDTVMLNEPVNAFSFIAFEAEK